MHIRDVMTSVTHKFIPFNGWNHIERAVNVYASGAFFQPVSAAAGAHASPRFALDAGWRVAQLLREARATLQHKARWGTDMSFPDFRLPYYMHHVEIMRRGVQRYALSVSPYPYYAAAEKSLATYLGIEQGFLSSEISVVTEPLEHDRFIFNVEEIGQCLAPALGRLMPSMAHLKTSFLSGAPVAVQHSRRMALTISPDIGTHTKRFIPEGGLGMKDTWDVQGMVVQGALGLYSVDDEVGEYEIAQPRIRIAINYFSKDARVGSELQQPTPVFGRVLKAKAHALTERLAHAFRQSLPR